jgi:NAD(P)-dependent dehydrogenase (short-subunit alcohol dehydrogenase family)
MLPNSSTPTPRKTLSENGRAAPKTVLITGGSEGGIGEALARQFHARGLRVFATALDLKEVEGLKAMGITVLSLDITDSDSITEVVASVSKATGGTLDFLVNNAGIGEVNRVPWKCKDNASLRCWRFRVENWANVCTCRASGYSQPLLDVDIAVAKKLFEINVFGLVEMTQKCAPLLIKSKGTIINQASIAAIVSAPFQGERSLLLSSLPFHTLGVLYSVGAF